MRILILALICAAVPTCVLAGPSAINFVGLVPGISTESDYDQTLVKYSGGRKGISVGGFEIVCTPDYIDGKLSEIYCPIGKNLGSLVEPVEYITRASNADVFRVLVDGYTKKFGKPDTILNDPVQTRAGADYVRQVVSWTDARGNELTLMSMTTSIDEGEVIMKSAAKLAADKAAERARDQQRNF
jgi:hypothetical protein